MPTRITIKQDVLKGLRRLGIEDRQMYKIGTCSTVLYPQHVHVSRKMSTGRQGVSPELVANLLRHLNKKPVVKVKATGASAANLRTLVEEVERATRSFVIHRSGTVLVLFRGFLEEDDLI